MFGCRNHLWVFRKGDLWLTVGSMAKKRLVSRGRDRIRVGTWFVFSEWKLCAWPATPLYTSEFISCTIICSASLEATRPCCTSSALNHLSLALECVPAVSACAASGCDQTSIRRAAATAGSLKPPLKQYLSDFSPGRTKANLSCLVVTSDFPTTLGHFPAGELIIVISVNQRQH